MTSKVKINKVGSSNTIFTGRVLSTVIDVTQVILMYTVLSRWLPILVIHMQGVQFYNYEAHLTAALLFGHS